MARPGGPVRADTLDLQDHDNPSAAEHQRHPGQNGVAPHQASQLNHVIEERHSEEQTLHEAWNLAGKLTEEPGAIAEAQANHENGNATNGTQQDGEEAGEGGESEAEGDDDMMDRISSSPSIDDEDIDFEFVYALHTFVATVEGQANATKGDTMVLLDDSNSYWWLVRVVKDSSIGYLPAEHIETPTERLARLNKHRNIDLSATMLSDNSEKTRNPLKKAMRRRNAKTVQFAAPTYVEASDYDYSTEDEEQGAVDPNYGAAAAQVEEPKAAVAEDPSASDSNHEDDERAMTPTQRASFEREQIATHTPAIDEPQLSPRLVDKTEAAPLKSKKGRNRDSFLKDETETRKITLTPGLLREDNASTKSVSSESLRNASTENLTKQVSPPEQAGKKDGKDKKKEKQKGGMLSGLFKSKKKDKKTMYDAGAESDMEKPSLEMKRSESPRPSPQASSRNSPVEKTASINTAPLTNVTPAQAAQYKQSQQQAQSQPQAQPQAPLQSQQQMLQPPSQSQARGILQKPSSQNASPVRDASRTQQQRGATMAELAGSEAAFEMATGHEAQITEASQPLETTAQQQQKESEGTMNSIKNMLTPAEKEPKPKKAKRSKQRVELDDFDSADEDEATSPNPFLEQEERQRRASGEDEVESKDRLSESPVHVTTSSGFGAFMQGSEIVHIPTPGEGPDSEQTTPTSLTSSPSIIEHPDSDKLRGPAQHEPQEVLTPEDEEPTPTAPRSLSPQHGLPVNHSAAPTAANDVLAPTRNLSLDDQSSVSSITMPSTPGLKEQAWSDSNLRSWLDDGSEVRDMLALINDKSDVVPVGPEHPIMNGLFANERKGVQKMMGDLDGLLGSYLQRKGISLV